MLYFICIWILLLQVCYIIGVGILNDLQAKQFHRQGDRFIAAVWLGVTVFAAVLLAVSLLLPLSVAVGGLTAFSLCGIALRSSATRSDLVALKTQISPSALCTALALATGVAYFTSRQVTWVDTGLYHYGIIQWLHQHGTVPGIALIAGNLGFTSSWFALTAIFSPIEIADRVSAIINGFALFISALSTAFCLHHLIKRNAAISDWFLALFFGCIFVMILGLQLFQDISISPSPDLPVLLLSGVITWSILVDVSPRLPPSLVPMILAIGAVAIKLTALPLLLITWLPLLINRPTLRRLAYAAAIVILMGLPVLLSGTVTSGCPLYPSSLFCLNLSWSIASTDVQGAAEGTHQWTNWFGTPPEGQPVWIWLLWRWFVDDKLNKVTALLITLSGFAAVHLLYISIKQRYYNLLYALAIGLLGIGFIMLTSPLFRFSVAYTLIIPVLWLSVFAYQQIQQKFFTGDRLLAFKPLLPISRSSSYISGLLIALFIVFGLRQNVSALLLPPSLQKSAVVKRQTNDIAYFSPQPGDLCWSTPIPCAFEVAPNTRLRDPARGIGAGFTQR